MTGEIIKRKNEFGNTVLYVERYNDFRQILEEQKHIVMYAGVKTINFKEYFSITLTNDVNY